MTDLQPSYGAGVSGITQDMHRDARAIFNAALQAVDPAKAVRNHCSRHGDVLRVGEGAFNLAALDRITVIGAGKASAGMAQAIEDLTGERISDGLICVKYGHGLPLKHIQIVEAGHPLPDHNGVDAARRMLELAHRARANDLILFLVSGGGSALLPLPVAGISLADKQAVTQALLACGAEIQEINTLRKHLSDIKGGRLALAAAPAAVCSLILSDVVGDDLHVIASGPTVSDPTTFSDCLDIVRRYDLGQKLPVSVMAHLKDGALGQVSETPKVDTHDWHKVSHKIVGSNFLALETAAREARSRGYTPLILSTRIQGETREVARVHGAIAREVAANGLPLSAPACILSGGETTVTLMGQGKGGRNQEFALAAARDIAGSSPIVLLSAGTDGTDGPTDAAGALVDHTTVQRAKQIALDINAHLSNNDAYPFFQALNDLLITGPTLTNVMDIRVMLIGKQSSLSSMNT